MNNWILYFVIYPVLAIIVFFISNWIGKYSYSLGYHKIDFIVDREDSVAFNFSLRVLTPTIFIILLSAIFYYFNLDYLTINIYFVVFYSVVIRMSVNLFMGRFHILDWRLQIFYAISICLVGYFSYEKLILPKKPLIPDFNTISNELWIIIGVFVYGIVNKIELSEFKKRARISNYIKIRYKNLSSKYENLIYLSIHECIDKLEIDQEIIKNYRIDDRFKDSTAKFLSVLIYSIMIFEDFNRSKGARMIENLIAKNSSKEMTLGIMQVKTDVLISDEQSIIFAVLKVFAVFREYLINSLLTEHNYYSDCRSKILSSYNSGFNYECSVESIFEILSSSLHNKEDVARTWFDSLAGIKK